MVETSGVVVSFYIFVGLFVGGCVGFGGAFEQEDIGVYELKRGNLSVKLTNYGATLLSLIIPDKNGKLDDVVLGFDSIDSYKNDTAYFGALVGRVANRIGGSTFALNGVRYNLPPNEKNNMLHGGAKGFSDVIWNVESHKEDSHVTFTYHSPDGDQGFPGELDVTVTYLLIGKNKLGINMEAKPLNKATPVNLASHTYWNLGGHNSGTILDHKIQIFGSKITPTDSDLIPTGEITSVQGTPYDFLQPMKIGSRLDKLPGGYDINYALDGNGKKHFNKVAVVEEPESGRRMQVWSNQLGVQFYTSNKLGPVEGKGGFVYRKFAGIALETQGYPDSVNHPNFPSQIVNPGEIYKHVLVYRFTAR